jgi:hypothetical protein
MSLTKHSSRPFEIFWLSGAMRSSVLGLSALRGTRLETGYDDRLLSEPCLWMNLRVKMG